MGAGAGMGGAGAAGYGGGAGMAAAADPYAGMGGAGMAAAAPASANYASLAGLAPPAMGAAADPYGMAGAGAAPAPPAPGSNAANIFIDPETGGNWNRTYLAGESPPVTENDLLVKLVVTNPLEQLGSVSEGIRQVVSRTVGTWANNVYWFDAQAAPATVEGAPPGSTELTLLVHNPNTVERSRQMSLLVNKDMVAGLMRATTAGGVEVVPGSVKGTYAMQPKKAGPAAGGLGGLTGGEFDRLYQQLNAPPPPPPPMNVTNVTALEAPAEKDGAGSSVAASVVVALAAAAAMAVVVV